MHMMRIETMLLYNFGHAQKVFSHSRDKRKESEAKKKIE
jgi:hypothetical protein